MRRVSKYNRKSQSTNFWQSYSDMMAALLLVFVLVLAGTMFQAQKNFEKKEQELQAERFKVEQQQKELKIEQEKAKEQEKTIKEQAAQLEKILGVRIDIIDKLKAAFEGSSTGITVDSNTGAISFDSNILFKTSKYDLQTNGKSFLNDFFPKYMDIILDDEISDYIAEIIIEGHTDDRSDYLYNLELSQNRAFAVAQYCLDDKTTMFTGNKLEKVRSLVTANGRSFYELIYYDNGKVNRAASRRVEIQFRLKDDEMIQTLIETIK